jgi:hypothetical protein
MIVRKTATKVKNGRVQKKNRTAKTPSYWNTYQDDIQIDIEKPGKGYKHFLKKSDIKKFLEILPEKEILYKELDAVVLAEGGYSCNGWYKNGVICICAWEKDMTVAYIRSHFDAHKRIFDKLNVKYKYDGDAVICDFTENQIKAYQLLHIFLHELGHHFDRINTSTRKIARGENYAENFAFKYEDIIWNRYFDCFQW